MAIFNNLPIQKAVDSSTETKNSLNNYYSSNLPLNAAALDAMTGFFESRGFQHVAAQTIAFIMFYQADIDGYDPFEVLDNIKGLEKAKLDELITQILNFNRYKSSLLGMSASYTTTPQVLREILP